MTNDAICNDKSILRRHQVELELDRNLVNLPTVSHASRNIFIFHTWTIFSLRNCWEFKEKNQQRRRRKLESQLRRKNQFSHQGIPEVESEG